MHTVALQNALQNLAHVYCTVANHVRSFCYHRTLATLVTVGSFVYYVSVNTASGHVSVLLEISLCLCVLCVCMPACTCVCACVCAEVTEVYDTMSCLPTVSDNITRTLTFRSVSVPFKR